MDKSFHLRLLGTPQVTWRSVPIHGFESRKALALLCYLAARAIAHEPQVEITRLHLSNLFWGDKSETQGRANLSRVLHNLTGLFPGAFHTTRDTIALADGFFSIDAYEFENDIAGGTVDALTNAAGLYRDEFLAGLFLDDCPEFEVWLVRERERWRQRIASALECLSGYYLRQQEYSLALPFVTRLLDIEPWREEAHQQMMRLLAYTGQRSAALKQFNLCKRVLAEELGVAPSAETVSLYESLYSYASTPTPHPSHHQALPVQLTSFVGRDIDIARIVARLGNPECRLLTLVGLGGNGKTRLALQVARHVQDSFRDGVYFVPLESIPVHRVDLVGTAIANALGLTFTGTQEPNEQLLHYLGAKHAVLILDNFEHLLAGTPLVLDILKHAPGVKIMVTCREPLNVQAEWLVHVKGLSVPSTVPPSLDEARLYSGVALFLERASRVDELFVADEQTMPAILRICEFVAGMPLAIELAAAATKSLTVHKIARQLASNLDLLTSPPRDVAARHGSLRTVLDWSYELLSPSLSTLFRRLAIFPNGWMEDAATAVCADACLDMLEIPNLLTLLVDKSLVLSIPIANDENRYHMLEPVRQYAGEKLQYAEDTAPLRERHFHFYLQLAETADSQLLGSEQQKWIRRLERESENFRVAFEWRKAQAQHLSYGLRLAIALGRFWSVRDLYGGRQQLSALLERVKVSDEIPQLSRALATAADLASRQGDHRAARKYWNESLALRRQVGNDADIANSLRGLGNAAFAEGDFATARRCYNESLELCRRADDPNGAAWSLSNLGLVAWNENDSETALELFDASQALRQAQGDQGGLAYLRNLYGLVAWSKGDYATMRELNEKGLAVQRELNDRWNMAYSLDSLGLAACGQGDYSAARTYLAESLNVFRELGDKWGIAYGLEHFGELAALEGKAAHAACVLGATEAFREAINLPRQPGEDFYYVRCMDVVRAAQSTDALAVAWTKGRAMAFEQAISLALEEE